MRAAEALAAADVVVAAATRIRDGVLPHCREDVEMLDVAGARRRLPRQAARRRPRRQASRSSRVFAGDPTVLCAFAEEADACAKAKVGFELVPGVSAAFAVPAYAGIPVTDKRTAPCTSSTSSRSSPEPDWARCDRRAQTLVLLNCSTAVGKAAAALVEHGRRGDTPVAVTAAGRPPRSAPSSRRSTPSSATRAALDGTAARRRR